MKILLKPLSKKLLLFSILIVLAFPGTAMDNGNKPKKSKLENNDPKENNTNEDASKNPGEEVLNTPVYGESAEDMASWYISQSIPKPEKVIKKEGRLEVKISRKIIKKERKACRKLQKSIKKSNRKQDTYN